MPPLPPRTTLFPYTTLFRSANTTYSVMVMDANGCINSGSTLVTVNSLSAVVVSTNASLCEGAATQISTSGGVSYSWIPSNGLNNTAVANAVASPSATTSYTV